MVPSSKAMKYGFCMIPARSRIRVAWSVTSNGCATVFGGGAILHVGHRLNLNRVTLANNKAAMGGAIFIIVLGLFLPLMKLIQGVGQGVGTR